VGFLAHDSVKANEYSGFALIWRTGASRFVWRDGTRRETSRRWPVPRRE